MLHRITNFICNVKPRLAVAVLVLADSTAILFAMICSLLLRFDNETCSNIYNQYLNGRAISTLTTLVIYICAFAIFRLYRCAWRFASLEMIWGIISANTIGLGGLVISQFVLDGRVFPRSVLVMLWTLAIVLTAAERVLLRILSIARKRGRTQDVFKHQPAKRAIILGAGTNGARVMKAVQEDPSLNYEVIGFLDDDPDKKGIYIGNARVLGPLGSLDNLVKEQSVDVVIATLADGNGHRMREFISECRKHKLPIRIVPRLRDMLNGNGQLQNVSLSIETLLHRPQTVDKVEIIGRYLSGKRVLVTGAGGSIGSELCRQIAILNPASLIILGHGENSIHQIHQELIRTFPELNGKLHYVIASVSHQTRINQAFELHRPQVVFHTAAHKHVPIMEQNEQEAVQNNVIGTRCVAEACGEYGVERVVLISTDKAADPCCVMGATKWLCEEIFRAMSNIWPKTSYLTVRFGNVLGSRGSVVPVFCDQIRRGGPVTVTHPEMTRYFMTIPEAVRLVLQAGAVGKTGHLYLLDMGRPVKVIDLAKDVIRLCGLQPDDDIKVEFTGIRPGEKLHEQLVSLNEKIERTSWGGLSIIHRPEHFCAPEILDVLDKLEHTAEHGNGEDIKQMLYEVACKQRRRAQTTTAQHPATIR